MKNQPLILIIILAALFGVGMGYWRFFRPQTSVQAVCAVENCHGLDIKCGSNPPDVCTAIYMIGDNCLPYARCGVQNGQCQPIQNAEFARCGACVQACVDANKNDNLKLFDCESRCD